MTVIRFVYPIALLSFAACSSFGQSIDASKNIKEKVPDADQSMMIGQTTLIKGRVRVVYDGDTVGIEGKDKMIYSIRLQGIDAPESGQNYGKASRKTLADLIEDKVVVVIVHEKDSQDRYIGTIYLDGQDIALKQIETGMAWHFKKYSYEQTANDRKRYGQAEETARTYHIGLWADEAPIPPWEYRGGETADAKAVHPSNLASTMPVENENVGIATKSNTDREPNVHPGTARRLLLPERKRSKGLRKR